MSTNVTIGLPKDELSGVGKVFDQLYAYEASTGASDWQTRQDWQDLWGLNYKK